MTVHLKTMVLFVFCFLFVTHCFSGEPEEARLSGETAYELFAGMLPPVSQGDWAEFRSDSKRIVKTVIESAELNSHKTMVIETRMYDSEGELSGVEARELVLPDSIREMIEKHEYFLVSPAMVTIKDQTINAELVRGFQGGVQTRQMIISSEIPLGVAALDEAGSTETLFDYGWGDATYSPRQDRLSFDEAFERIASTLPEPNPGEWCEYYAPGMDENFVKRFRIVCGVDGRDGGRMLSRYTAADGESHFLPWDRLTKAETREEYGETMFGKMEYFTITREIVSVKGETKPVMTLNMFIKDFCGVRLRFSPELPYPWLAGAVFIVEEGGWSGARLVDWGWKPPEDIERLERRATVDDAIAAIVDIGLEQTAIGDWALYETLDGGTIRYGMVDIQTEEGALRYTDLVEEFDVSGKLVKKERRTNTREQIINFYLPSGDFDADSFALNETETTVMGESISVLSITGFQEGTPVYRVDCSSQIPCTQFVNVILHSISPDPVWKLVEFGRR